LVRIYDHIGGPEVAGDRRGVTFVTEGEAGVDLFLAEAGTAAAFLSSHA
jgi:hypothetical protein